MDSREARWSQAMLAERRGDAAAYQDFLEDFAAAMRRLIAMNLRRFGLTSADAEDVLQEVLIAVHARRGQWDQGRPLVPWLNAIARYKTIDAARRLRRESRGRVDLSDDERASVCLSDEWARDHHPADVDRLVSILPPGQQALVRAVAIEGLSHRDAAHRFETTEGAVRVAFHRSMKRLVAATAEWRNR